MAEEKSKPPRVLVADDQVDVREALRLLLKAEGMEAQIVASPNAALEELYSGEFDVALIDLNYTRDTTSGREGLDLLTQIQATDADLPVIVMTAWGSIDLAVEAMRRGARDFIQKPWENPRLISILHTQVNLARSLRRTRQLEAENRLLRAQGRPTFIAEAPSMRPVLDLIARVGPSDAIAFRVSKCTTHVSEQLAFEDTFSEGARIQRDQRLRSTRRDRVKNSRDHFLACAVLAGDKHVRVRRTDTFDEIQH